MNRWSEECGRIPGRVPAGGISGSADSADLPQRADEERGRGGGRVSGGALNGFVPLAELRREVAERCGAIETAHGAWPCRAGCDHCCRNLGRQMELPETEWAEVEKGLALLPEAAQREVAERLERPGTVCPFLDEAIGQCRIYEHRPVACRTYGYYMERDGGRYCGMIREKVEQGRMEGVVWGNHAAVEQQLGRLGRMVGLEEWRVLTGLLFFKRS